MNNIWPLIILVTEGNKRCKALRDQVLADSAYRPLTVLNLLMNTAKLELKLKEVTRMWW